MSAMTLGELLSAPDDDVELTTGQARQMAARLGARDRRGNSEAHTLAEVLDAYTAWLRDHPGRRWPVIRTGERTPIPSALRLSIYLRDDECCRLGLLAQHSTALELDHLIPWSAGGPDDSDNLRTACSWCNSTRCNFIEPSFDRRYLPTTWWCVECWTLDSPPRRPWRDDTAIGAVPRITDDAGPCELVYCAHCREGNYSPLLFVGPLGRRLLDLIAPSQRLAAS